MGLAYGEFFGGKSGFDEERIAFEKFVFNGIYMNEQAEKTFKKMKEIYDANNGVSLNISKFSADNDDTASSISDPLMDGDLRYAIGDPEFRGPYKK